MYRETNTTFDTDLYLTDREEGRTYFAKSKGVFATAQADTKHHI